MKNVINTLLVIQNVFNKYVNTPLRCLVSIAELFFHAIAVMLLLLFIVLSPAIISSLFHYIFTKELGINLSIFVLVNVLSIAHIVNQNSKK